MELSILHLSSLRNEGVSALHWSNMENKWTTILKVAGASTSAKEIDYQWLEDYQGARRGMGVSGQTIKKEYNAISKAIKIAKRRGILAHALDSEDIPRVRKDPPHPRLSGKLRNPDVIRKYLGELPQDAKDEMSFAFLTGLRATEIKRLEPGWVEPAPHGSKVRALLRLPPSGTKTRKERIVGLSDQAFAIIQRRLAEDPTRAQVFSQKNHKTAFRLATNRVLGKDAPVITLRDMRHTFASLAAAESGDARAVQSALGHSDLNMTNRYLSSTINRTADLALLLEAHLTDTGAPEGLTGDLDQPEKEG